MKQGDVDELQRFSQLVWHSEVWRVRLNIQHRFEKGYSPSAIDSLQLDLRQLPPIPGSIVKHRQVGSLWLNATQCALRLEQGNKLLVACLDPSEKALAQYSKLVGKTLLRVEITAPAGDTSFILENGMSLRCFPVNAHDGKVWALPHQIMPNYFWDQVPDGRFAAVLSESVMQEFPYKQMFKDREQLRKNGFDHWICRTIAP